MSETVYVPERTILRRQAFMEAIQRRLADEQGSIASVCDLLNLNSPEGAIADAAYGQIADELEQAARRIQSIASEYTAKVRPR